MIYVDVVLLSIEARRGASKGFVVFSSVMVPQLSTTHALQMQQQLSSAFIMTVFLIILPRGKILLGKTLKNKHISIYNLS